MNRTLLSLAIIRTNWDQLRKDYVENFVPLVSSLIKKKGYVDISFENIKDLKEDFDIEYGLLLPTSALFTILNRLSKQNLIIRDHGKFKPNYEKINKIDISKKSDQLQREHQKVIKSLEQFIQNKYSVSIDLIELEKGIVKFLKKYDLDLLFASDNISMLPKVKTSQKIDYYINEFIADSFQSEPDLFKYILDLTIGHALSATILYKEFNSYSGKMKDLNIYLDTPLIMDLLGLHGQLKKQYIEEIIFAINKNKANLYILDITRGEIEANLRDALSSFEKGYTTPDKGNLTFKNCLQYDISESEIEKIYIDLVQVLKPYNIKLDSVPDHVELSRFQVDEEKLYETIIKTYEQIGAYESTKKNYDTSYLKPLEERSKKILSKGKKKKKDTSHENDESIFSDESKINQTIYRDVKVLSGIYRFRRGNKPKTLKSCKYLFVTSNSALAFASRIFERDQSMSNGLATSLTATFLGTLIWLHSPAELKNINEKTLIADCYASMTPSDKLITKYIEMVEKLKDDISMDDYYLLRSFRASINILEAKTLGDPDELTPKTIHEIIDEIIDRITKEERDKLLGEQKDHEKTKTELELLKEKELERTKTINDAINIKSTKKTDKFIGFINISSIILLIISSITEIIYQVIKELPLGYLLAAHIILTVAGLFNIINGFNIRGIKDKLYNNIYDRIYKKEKNKIAGLL